MWTGVSLFHKTFRTATLKSTEKLMLMDETASRWFGSTRYGGDTATPNGLSVTYGQNTKQHTITLTNLDWDTTYHYRLVCWDADENLYTGTDHTFTTPTEPEPEQPEEPEEPEPEPKEPEEPDDTAPTEPEQPEDNKETHDTTGGLPATLLPLAFLLLLIVGGGGVALSLRRKR